MMKKLITVALIVLGAATFAMDWYSSKEMLGDIRKAPRDTKDTLWYGYYPGYAFVWTLAAERAVYINVNDFGLEYPINLHAIDSYLYSAGYEYSYKVYDKDGETLLWELDAPDTSSEDGYNIHMFDSPMIMKDDFWISVVPLAGGNPTLISSDVTTSDHSFYKTADGWVPFENSDGRYEWAIDFGLSPYEGTDTYAPMVRELNGTSNFENSPLNITAMIQDQSALNVVTGQYNVGAGWVDFPMTASKTTYYYTGTIPAQAHGTTGTVRVYAEDAFANSSTSAEYPITWSKDYPLVHEKFEGETFPPAGWTQEATGTGFIQGVFQINISQPELIYDGKNAFHEDSEADNWDFLILPQITVPADNSTVLKFMQCGYWTEFYSEHYVIISEDPVNWDTAEYIEIVPAPAGTSGHGGVWEERVLSLAAYKGKDIHIAFTYGGYFADQWYIDDVEVFYDYKAPEITNIYANEALLPVIGAYLGSPMNITLNVQDQSGIESIVGHYTFDGGTTVEDVVFVKSKMTKEVWTGTIPARSVESSGYIYFDTADTGGVSGTTSNYDIQFVTDHDAPVVTSFDYGAPVFMGSDMNITVTFDDESTISVCNAYYSKDNWATSTPVTMTPSKIFHYTYTGTIPAEAAETFAEIYFEIEDGSANNTQTEKYKIAWLDGAELLYDDFDANHNPADWTYEGTWGLTESQSHSATHSLNDSPDGNHAASLNISAITQVYDFTTVKAATIYFWAMIELETGYDYTYLEGTSDGSTWKQLANYNGEGEGWKYYTVDIGAFAGQDSVQFRFRLVSDALEERDGMFIDDIKIAVFNQDYSAPLITFAGTPTTIVGTEDIVLTATIEDLTGIAEAKVVYSIDGGADQEAVSDPASGSSGTYTFTIPAQQAGATIIYKLTAKDATTYENYAETKTYKALSGYHLNYANGYDFIDYLDIIGTSSNASAYAVAERLTMGPMDKPDTDTYRADLVGFTIANYISDSYPSDPLYAHVWASDGKGAPGADLIEPILMNQASTLLDPYALTYVDLRPYASVLSAIEGDVFVGYTSAGTQTNILYEVVANHAGVPGYVDFNRSWLGQKVGEDIEWTFDDADNYCITGITGSYEWVGIGEDNLPKVTRLEQNYPNPFNPATKINFSIAKDSKVSLVVYDVMGREVANLVNGNLARGSHSVSFDASNLVSGVYYYTLKAAGVNQTRKMMLIK